MSSSSGAIRAVRFLSPSHIATMTAATAIAILGMTVAQAANPQDLAKVKEGGRITSCIQCDLSGADLRNGFFQLAILVETNFSGANLDGANLAGAQLNKANLSKVSANYANLSGARMEGADLRGANFTKSWFNWAWFEDAQLDGANFNGANMIGAQLQGADLSNVVGLQPDQLLTACGDHRTKLPPGIKRPQCPY